MRFFVPRSAASHTRRLTRAYKRRQEWVKNLWIGSGLLMIQCPLPMMMALGLLTTCLSFVLLDEIQGA